MPFKPETVERRFTEYAKGKCENCGKTLVKANRGCNKGGRGAWEAHHKKPVSEGGSDTIANCQILCCDCNHNPNLAAKNSKDNQKPKAYLFGVLPVDE